MMEIGLLIELLINYLELLLLFMINFCTALACYPDIYTHKYKGRVDLSTSEMKNKDWSLQLSQQSRNVL